MQLLCECALLPLFKSVFALEEGIQIAIDIGSDLQLIWYYYLCLSSFLLCELLFDHSCYYQIYACVLTTFFILSTTGCLQHAFLLIIHVSVI